MDWHLDIYTMKNAEGEAIRENKITGIIFLEDGDSYIGGELEILRGQAQETISCSLGIILFFPTTIMHRVKRINDGVRNTVIFNFLSTPFR